METWKDIEGFEGRYKVSDKGRVKSYIRDKENGRLMKQGLNYKGYPVVGLSDGHKTHFKTIHRLVASAFIDNEDNLPQVNHKDEIKTNNTVGNLEWCSNDYNMHYGTRSQRAAESNKCCPTTSKQVCYLDDSGNEVCYMSIGQAERETGNSHCNIVRQLKGRRKTCGGRKWYYKD